MQCKDDASFSIPDRPPLMQELQNLVNHPDDIDSATDHLGIPPALVNPYLATHYDMSDLGLGQAIYLPVQISRQRGARKSLYYLQPGEKVLSGILVTSAVLAFRYVSRETGCSVPAQAGDEYVEEIRSVAGGVISSRRGRLEVTNIKKGEGRLVFQEDTPPAKTKKVNVWVIFSCINVEVES